MVVNRGWAGVVPGRDGGSRQSRWAGNPSEARWRRQLLTTLTVTHDWYLVEAPGKGWLTAYAVYGRRSQKTKQTQNIRVVSGRRRGGSVLARERKGSGSSHSGEWRGRGVLSGAREKATLVTCTIDTPPLRDVHVDREKISEPLLSRSSCLQLAGRPRCL